jgi:hypothetical protein
MLDEPWKTISSSRLPYRIRVPQGWMPQEPTESQKDEVWGDENLLTVEIATMVADATPADFSALSEANVKRIGFKLQSSELMAVAGMEARVFQLRLDRFIKKAIHVLRAAFHDGTYGWEVTLTVGDGSVEPDRSLFLKVLSTFERLDILLAADDTSGNVWALEPGDCFAALPFQVAKGELTVFMGGVDGFRRVACSEPHSGEVVAVLRAGAELPGPMEEIFGAYTGEELARSELGVVLMNPLLPEEKVPAGVEGVFVIAHPAGLSSGSVKRSEVSQ